MGALFTTKSIPIAIRLGNAIRLAIGDQIGYPWNQKCYRNAYLIADPIALPNQIAIGLATFLAVLAELISDGHL